MSLESDISAWLQTAGKRLDDFQPTSQLAHIGEVQQISDGVAVITGLPGTRLDEYLLFEDGTPGLALRLDADEVGCVLLGDYEGIKAGSKVRGTNEVLRVPVGEALLGRIVDSLGRPLDNGPDIKAKRYDPVERPAPAIVDRDLVTRPMHTGITVVDAMIPLGRGQRELIIGDRKTGKTSVAIDAIISQRSSEVISIYASIGQKAFSVNQVVEAVRKHGCLERTFFVVGAADAPPGAQWITPYAATTMAEYFRDQGLDVLLVFDDLTHHAIIYRQLSLLLRDSPGREAYPGDIFYIHARLLERAAKLSKNLGGGSLTMLPIAETQAGNLSGYIPTNLISITDGQIYLEPKLFYEGQKPAVNVGLSVSRVGGKTQAPVMKRLASTLRLEYAQFLELEVFTRFGAMLDERTQKTITHGRRIREILRQNASRPIPLAEQVALLSAVGEKMLDELSLDLVDPFKHKLGSWLARHNGSLCKRIEETGDMSQEDKAELLATLDRFIQTLAPPQTSATIRQRENG